MTERWKYFLLHALVSHIGYIALPQNREWATAMVGEIQHIEHLNDALVFAFGGVCACYEAIYRERIKAMGFETFLRLGAALFAAGWGAMKISYATLILVPAGLSSFPLLFSTTDFAGLDGFARSWQLGAFYISAITFLASAYALVIWRHERLVLFGAMAFAVNVITAAMLSLSFTFSLPAGPELLWSLGIVIEEFVALTGLLFAGFVVWRLTSNISRQL